MSHFILVSDPRLPAIKPWWVIRVAKGDFATVTSIHEWFATALFIRDGNNPHIQADRANPESNGHLLAAIKHPVLLGAAFLGTAMKMATYGDFYINPNGGMRPCDDLIELRHVEGSNWPSQPHPTRRITISTWGNHFYLTADYIAPITFLDKFNTEEEAMAFAILFATADHITLKREARQFRDGD